MKFIIFSISVACLSIIVYGKKKEIPHATENEVFEKTHPLTLKFPMLNRNVKFSTALRRTKVNIEAVEEDCRSQTFKNELSKLMPRIKCEPRDTVVELLGPLGTSLTPNTIIVKRCSGMCNASKKCLSAGNIVVKFYIRKIRNNQIYCSSVDVSEDTNCRCKCEKRSSDCSGNQTYAKDICACVCKNEKDYDDCMQRSSKRFYWDEKNCLCVCRQNKYCTTGTIWLPSECRCAKIMD